MSSAALKMLCDDGRPENGKAKIDSLRLFTSPTRLMYFEPQLALSRVWDNSVKLPFGNQTQKYIEIT